MDASIVVHAMLKPRGEPGKELTLLKQKAARAMTEIDAGAARVVTTVVHLNEVANLLKRATTGGLPESHRVVERILSHPAIEVRDVTRVDYAKALDEAKTKQVDLGDALAWLLMRDVLKTDEVYTTNEKHFRQLNPKVKILPV